MATPKQRQQFGRALKAARKAQEWTLRRLSQEMAAAGDEVTEATLSGYEGGQYAPRDADRVRRLEELLNVGHVLTGALGLASSGEGSDPGRLATVGDLDALRQQLQSEFLEAVRAGQVPIVVDVDELDLDEAVGEDGSINVTLPPDASMHEVGDSVYLVFRGTRPKMRELADLAVERERRAAKDDRKAADTGDASKVKRGRRAPRRDAAPPEQDDTD